MSFARVLTSAALLVLAFTVVPARAQVSLRFHDGLVTLRAQNAPLRAILAEWARLGGTTVVNGERVVGPPLTLELNAVPEAQALAVLLRSVSGYMAALRATGTPGVSLYDRILILPTSAAPRPTTPAPVGFQQPRPTLQRPPIIQPDPEPEPEPEPEIEEEPLPDDDVPPVAPLVRPGVVGARPQPFPIPRPGMQPDPVDDDIEQPEPEPDEQAEPANAPPTNPFGVPTGSTSRPGVVTPVPRAPREQNVTPVDPDP